MSPSFLPIEYTVETIDYAELKDESEMSFAERLAMQIEQADAKVTINRVSHPFDWDAPYLR